MKFHKAEADVFVPDGSDGDDAIRRTTHMGIGAHQDDIEIMAYHGVVECFGKKDKWFTGVTCTDGAGSPRSGLYESYSDEDMRRVRMQEQRAAAMAGRYSAQIQLGYASKEAKSKSDARLTDDLASIFDAARPDVVYTHNPADKHATHVAVMMAVIAALRRLPQDARPSLVYGCEVWRSLDWLPDDFKKVLDASPRPNLAAALLDVYDSQISGGKRYDLAVIGQRRSNATYLDTHGVDLYEAATYAMDLTPLIKSDTLTLSYYVGGMLDKFRSIVSAQLGQ